MDGYLLEGAMNSVSLALCSFEVKLCLGTGVGTSRLSLLDSGHILLLASALLLWFQCLLDIPVK